MLVTNDLSRDARVQKEAAAAADAGAVVTVVAVGKGCDWSHDGVVIRSIEPIVPSRSWLWPVRVAHNLFKEWQVERRMAECAASREPDIIHANDIDTLQSAFWAAGSSVPVVYDAHELSTQFVTIPWWKRALWRRRESRLIDRAAAVVTVNWGTADWLKREYGLKTCPTVVMNAASHCVNRGAGVGTPLRLLFQGVLFPDRGVEALVDAVAELNGKVHLTIQGWGGVEAELHARVKREGLQELVQFCPPCPPSEVVDSASAYDVGVISYRGLTENLRLSSPNKLFDYIGAGLAVVASDLPVIKSIVEREGVGLVFDPTVAGSLARALEGLADSPERVLEMQSRSASSCRQYCWQTQAAILLRTYEEALASCAC